MSAGAVLLCIGLLGGPVATTVPADTFTLSWTHSVEKVEWRETWRVTPEGFRPVEARVRGSGAGMEPPPDARFVDGWYVYVPDLATVPEIVLPDSPFSDPAEICAVDTCRTAHGWAGRGPRDPRPVRLASCSP